MKTLFKWLFRLLVGLVLAAVVLALGRNLILRNLLEWRLAAATGMEARIGYLHLALTEPTVRIEDLKLYSPAEFGGSTFVEVPEVYVEYDRGAILSRRIHLGRVRFNLATLNVVENKEGRTNLERVLARQKTSNGGGGRLSGWSQSVVAFAGIDRLDLTLGRVVFTSLKKPGQVREVNLDVKNAVLKNVKSARDFNGLLVSLMLKHGKYLLGLSTAAPVKDAAAEAVPVPGPGAR